jgi:hypothetical protein
MSALSPPNKRDGCLDAVCARLAARIEGLAQQSDSRPAVAYVWWDRNDTEEQALERHYADRPGDRAAKSTYVFSWRGRRRRDQEDAEAAD